MESYFVRRRGVSAVARWVLSQAAFLVRTLPSHRDSSGREIRCHELAEAVATVVGDSITRLRVEHGHFGHVAHSWIRVGDHPCAHILDVYMPGAEPQVVLVDGVAPAPLLHLYDYTKRPNFMMRWDVVAELTDRFLAARVDARQFADWVSS